MPHLGQRIESLSRSLQNSGSIVNIIKVRSSFPLKQALQIDSSQQDIVPKSSTFGISLQILHLKSSASMNKNSEEVISGAYYGTVISSLVSSTISSLSI